MGCSGVVPQAGLVGSMKRHGCRWLSPCPQHACHRPCMCRDLLEVGGCGSSLAMSSARRRVRSPCSLQAPRPPSARPFCLCALTHTNAPSVEGRAKSGSSVCHARPPPAWSVHPGPLPQAHAPQLASPDARVETCLAARSACASHQASGDGQAGHYPLGPLLPFASSCLVRCSEQPNGVTEKRARKM